MNKTSTFTYISNSISVLLLMSGAILAISWFQKNRLPEPNQIVEELFREPRQSNSRESVFSFSYSGTDYVVEPVSEYELYGMVVSHNDISAWWNIYQSEKNVDLKDLCVIWGGNLKDKWYQKAEFWSEAWSCHVKMHDQETFESYEATELSNNHLLSDSESIWDKVRDVHIGDQIHL